MGQTQAKQQEYDPNQVISKEEYEENIKNFNQFVRHHSQKDLRKEIEESQIARSTHTNGKVRTEKGDDDNQIEEEENNDIYRNNISNLNQQIGEREGEVSKIYKDVPSSEYAISDWIQLIIKDMTSAGFQGYEYEIHHTDVSIKLVLEFTNENFHKIEDFVDLNYSLWMEYVMIEISYHMFDKVGIAKICNHIQKLYHLQYLILDFSNNKIAMNNECISRCVSNLPDLKTFTFNIQGNKIGEEGIRLISKSLSNLRFLNQLNLNLKWNNMLDSGLYSISDVICQMRFINQLTLDISGNSITDEGACFLFDQISTVGQLQQLSITASHNYIKSDSCIALAECLKQQDNLVELALLLDGNYITQNGVYPLLGAFKQLYNLVKLTLDLSHNNVEVYDAKLIRDDIYVISYIKQKNIYFF